MPKTVKRLILEHLRDLAAVLIILAKELIVAVVIIVFGNFLATISVRFSAQRRWSTETIEILSDVFAILTFVGLAIRDLWVYFKKG